MSRWGKSSNLLTLTKGRLSYFDSQENIFLLSKGQEDEEVLRFALDKLATEAQPGN